ncbi:hypothetical protein ACQJBY_003652 [Aegilops geniculata]
MPVPAHFVPAPRSPLGPRRRLLGSFFPNAGGLLKDAVPLASRSGLLLVRLRSISLYWDDDERGLVRLAVCNPLAGTWDELPPLRRGSSSMSEVAQCAILTDTDHGPKRRPRKPLPGYTTFFKVAVIMHGYSRGAYSMYTFSSAESSWSTPRRCFALLEYTFVHGNPVVSRGNVHWLIKGLGNFWTLEFCIETEHISITQLPVPQGIYEYNRFNHAPLLSVTADGKSSLICLHKNFLQVQIFTCKGDQGDGNGVADALHIEVIELKHKPRQTTKALYVCVGEKSATLLVIDQRKFMCTVNLETGTIDEVTGMSSYFKGHTVVPFEIDWSAFFMSSLEAH